jgi:hypothetical protein
MLKAVAAHANTRATAAIPADRRMRATVDSRVRKPPVSC